MRRSWGWSLSCSHITAVPATSPCALPTISRAGLAQQSASTVLHLLLYQHLFSQLCDLPSTCSSILHSFAIDHGPAVAGVFPLADFPFAVEICAGDVEGVDMRGDDGAEEEHAVYEEVGVHAAEEGDAEGWEEDIDYGDGATFEDHGDGVLGCVWGSVFSWRMH